MCSGGSRRTRGALGSPEWPGDVCGGSQVESFMSVRKGSLAGVVGVGEGIGVRGLGVRLGDVVL